MMLAVVFGFIAGFFFLILRSRLIGTENERIWQVLYALLFKDISASKSFDGIGLFYIIGQLFMRGLQMMIVPLVICSLTLALCSLADPKRLGRIAGKTLVIFFGFYTVAAALAGGIAYFVKSMGWFDVNLPTEEATAAVMMDGYNPLVTIVNAIPGNIVHAMSENSSILSVVTVAIVFGICMTHFGEKARPLKNILEILNDTIQLFLEFLINKTGPVAIFCMITRALAIYGIEYIRPALVWIVTTVFVGLFLVSTIYPAGIALLTKLNPFIFLRKSMKIGLFAAATNSSAATLPINTRTCVDELGCSEEISSFVLPTGMTINMNGTTAMHMVAITFIGTAAGIDVTPATLITAAFLSICTAVGTPAIPVAGTTMVYVVMMGLGFNSELCMIGYSLVLAMNYLPGMAVITLNVVGDAATNVIVNYYENALNKDIYNKK